MKVLTAAVLCLNRVLYFFGAVAVVLMMFHVVLDVASRALLGTPTFGMVETVTNYYMIALCFLPLAFVQDRGAHLTVESFTYSLSPAAIRGITAFSLLVAAVIAALLTWHSGVSAIEQTRSGEYVDITAMDFPIWPAHWLLVFGYGAVFVTLCLQFVLVVAGRVEPGRGIAGG